MMGCTGRIESGIQKFNRVFCYDIFWIIIINEKFVRKCVPHGAESWRLIDGTDPDLI